MVEEAYVSFEVAKLLKEKGFNEPITTAYLCSDGKPWDKRFIEMSDEIKQDEWYDAEDTVRFGHLLLCPTHQMAMAWLREEKNVLIQIVTGMHREIKTPKKHTFLFQIYKDMEFVSFGKTDVYNTYEEAVEAALRYYLEKIL